MQASTIDQEQLDKINGVLAWADDHPEFDAGFLQSLKANLEFCGNLSPAQEAALDNIIEKWRIDLDEYS